VTIPTPSPDSAELLDQLLASLFEDFDFWFQRGLLLLDRTPEALMRAPERQSLRADLTAGLAGLAAARALLGAAPTPMAVAMEAMVPWHRLMMRVWTLSSLLRRAGVALPDDSRG
jgi:hypothetical protein